MTDSEGQVPAKWFRRAHWAVYFFFGLVALSGLGYVYYKALVGDVVGALVGLGIVFVSIGLGIAMHSVVRMAAVIDANLNTITILRHRHNALEQVVERLGTTIELNRAEVTRVSTLMAASTDTDCYPRLADASRAVCEIEPIPDAGAVAAAVVNQVAIDCERRSCDANGEGAETLPSEPPELREAFRQAIFAQNFAQAIVVGERIRELHPQSPMAEQYNELYESIACRVGDGGAVSCESTLATADSL